MHGGARELAERCVGGDCSPAIAVVRLLALWGDGASARSALDSLAAADGEGRELGSTVAEMRALLDAGGDLVLRILAHERRPAGPAGDDVARCARMFEKALRESPEASVALYSLGSRALLDAATAEVVALLERLGVLGPERRILEIGCGIGRFQQALAPRVAALTGIDIAPGMIREARRRCAGLPNVALMRTSGLDLTAFPAAAFDTVLAIDSLPYVHRVGMALLETHFREAARVLRERGDFVVLNLTYRGDLALDCEDAARLAGQSGLRLLCSGSRDLELWDGATFHMRKSRPGARSLRP